MKRQYLFVLFGLFLCLAAFPLYPNPGACQEEGLLQHPREMTFPPLSFTPPQAKRATLANGLAIYLLEDPELPLIQLSVLIRTGSMYDPPQKSGLAGVAAQVWRNGGTQKQTSQAINETLESMAAILEFSMSRESGSISLSVRKKDFPRALAILADLLQRPAFDAAQLDLAKKQEIETIRRSNDSPEEIAYREFRKILYAGTPRGQVPTIGSVEKIQQEDLFAFHKKFFYPNNFLLGISGDFQTEEMVASIERVFGGWERAIIELPYIPLPKSRSVQSIYHAEKDLTQSTIFYGQLSIPLDHPDHIPFKVLNFLLGGGGFNSRLTREIRSNQGLAYSVGSFYQGRVGYGVFGAFCQTKSTSTGRVISLLEGIIGGIKTNKPGPEELAWAKNSLNNQFIFSFTSSGHIVTQQMQLEYDGLPADTLQRYPERVQAVSLEDLNRVAENDLHPDQSILLVVGKEKDFDQPLSSFGPVNRLELKKYD